jgi:hypothetical protein
MDTKLTIPRFAPITNMVLNFDVKVEIIEGTPITEKMVGDYVEIPNAEDINFNVDQDFSIEVWVKAASQEGGGVLEKWEGGGTPYPYVIRYLDNNGKGDIKVARYDGEANGANNPSITSTNTNINDGQFHYVTFVKNGIYLYLYIDGQLDPTPPGEPNNPNPAQDTTTGSTQNSSPIYLARRGNGISFFKGQIGQLRIWSISLTSEQIWSYYNQGPFIGHQDSLIAKPGLVGDWRCNEGYGNIAFDYARGNNGVLGGTTGELTKPEWVVSTIGLLPLFIDKAPSSFISMNSLLAQSKQAIADR